MTILRAAAFYWAAVFALMPWWRVRRSLSAA
jgi:hypothetical protein